MKRLTEGAHQTSDDLTVVNAAYFWWIHFREQMFTVVGSTKEVLMVEWLLS